MNEILQAIRKMMSNSAFEESFFEEVLQKLISLGYKLEENDAFLLCFAMQSVENHIKSSCNVTIIPNELLNAAVDRVCGEFLFTKKQTGKLELADLDLNGAITSIHEGDVTVQFASGSSDEDKFNSFLNYLMHKGEGDFVCYRKLKW